MSQPSNPGDPKKDQTPLIVNNDPNWTICNDPGNSVLTFNGGGNLSFVNKMYVDETQTSRITMEGEECEIKASKPITLSAPLPKDKIDRFLQEGALHSPKKLKQRIEHLYNKWEETGQIDTSAVVVLLAAVKHIMKGGEK